MTTNDKKIAIAVFLFGFIVLLSVAKEDKQIHVLLTFILLTLLCILAELTNKPNK